MLDVAPVVDGEPHLHFVELRENGMDRLCLESERRCAEWRERLLRWVGEDRPLFGWRNGAALRLGSSMIGGMVCRTFVVPPRLAIPDASIRSGSTRVPGMSAGWGTGVPGIR
jgi:hypothetical protein